MMRGLTATIGILIGLFLVAGCGGSAPSGPSGQPAPSQPSAAQPSQPSAAAQPLQHSQPPSADGFTTLPTSGGFTDVNTDVTDFSANSLDGGGIRLTVQFGQGIPVWAVHSSSHGQMIWLELSAGHPLWLQRSIGSASSPPPGNEAGIYGYRFASTPTSSWVTVNGRGPQEYRTAVRGNSLVLEVRPVADARRATEGDLRMPQGADLLVEQFLTAQVQGQDVKPYLTETARAQYAKLPPFRPTAYRIMGQGGLVPGTLFYTVRLTTPQAFTDQFLFVTPVGGAPQISLILGHQPVTQPADPEGSAALTAAFAYLDAWTKRDGPAMYAALAPAEQQGMTEEQKRLLGGLSNPHPFRYEVLAFEQVSPGCYRLQVLRSEEYTGEGELGRGVDGLYVTQADGRWGVLPNGGCGK